MAPLQRQNAWPEGRLRCQLLYDAAHKFDSLTFLVPQRKASQGWVRSAPYFLAGSLVKGSEEPRTFWLSAGADPTLYTDLGLVSGLSPIGRTLLLIKNAIKDGREFTGSANHAAWVQTPAGFSWRSAGPPIDYIHRQSPTLAQIERCVIWESRNDEPLRVVLTSEDDGALVAELAAEVREATVGRVGFGLGDVLASLDTSQIGNVDFPDDGPLFVTGAAGTGKTTVAFYRAAYLLEEQRAALEADPKSSVYFDAKKMLVLVRREHLKPYLSRLAREVGVEKLPVQTFDQWFQWEVFRPYLRRGRDDDRGTVLFDVNPDVRLERWTGALTEDHVRSFIGREFRTSLQPSHDECAAAVATLRKVLTERGLPTRLLPSRVDAIRLQLASVFRELSSLGAPSWVRYATAETYFERLTAVLKRLTELTRESDLSVWGEALLAPIEDTRRVIDRIRRRLPTNLFRFDRLSKSFYRSQPAVEALHAAFPDEEEEALTILSDEKRAFSRADDVVVGWLIHTLTEGMAIDSDLEHLRPLPQYDHIILDEAQFYPPAFIRLLQLLAKSPRRAITVVGDLEQRSSASGLTDWKALVSAGNADRVKRLDRIYRASREIYPFLLSLNERLGLNSQLQMPREFDRFNSELPKLVLTNSDSDEAKWVADAASGLRKRYPHFAIAVVIPLRGNDERIGMVVNELNGAGVPARAAHGEDIGERLDKVLVTDSDSVVGGVDPIS